MAELSVEDQHRISAAIRTAERQTSGEIVCVLARASSDYLSYATAWSALIALLSPWFLLAFTQLSVHVILAAQIVIFVTLYLFLSQSALLRFLMPRGILRAQAHRAAMEQFMIRGMARKKNRAGILIFVSLAEHYARIVADEGIASKAHPSVWQEAVDALLERAKAGEIAEGFILAAEICGRPLAEHFPPGAGGEDELPDRIYVI
jgi:putative membrane protein